MNKLETHSLFHRMMLSTAAVAIVRRREQLRMDRHEYEMTIGNGLLHGGVDYTPHEVMRVRGPVGA